MPHIVTVCEPALELSVITSLADREPLALGLKTTLIEQLDPGATGLPHSLVCWKSAASAPETVVLSIVNSVAPVLVIVMVFVTLAVFTFCVPKPRLVALK